MSIEKQKTEHNFLRLFQSIWGKEKTEPSEQPHFFRTSQEYFLLQTTPPSEFILMLPDEHLFEQIAGAAFDSFYALHEEQRAADYLAILNQSDFWEKHFKGKHDPAKHIATACAFLIKIDGMQIGNVDPFLNFCNENHIVVTQKSIEQIIPQLK
jgi:hypothetical protein